jgi:hypothetical protein
VIAVGAPRRAPDGGWFCTYSIGWPDGARLGEGWGLDSAQAILLTMRRIGADLYASPHHASGALVWEKPADGYGFPVPDGLKDMLIGSDKADFGR